MLLDIRLNTLSKFIDKFVIVEASYKHNGDYKENLTLKSLKNFKIKLIISSLINLLKDLILLIFKMTKIRKVQKY